MSEPEMSKIHEKLSVQCFNKAIEFIMEPTRTPNKDKEMLRTRHGILLALDTAR